MARASRNDLQIGPNPIKPQAAACDWQRLRSIWHVFPSPPPLLEIKPARSWRPTSSNEAATKSKPVSDCAAPFTFSEVLSSLFESRLAGPYPMDRESTRPAALKKGR